MAHNRRITLYVTVEEFNVIKRRAGRISLSRWLKDLALSSVEERYTPDGADRGRPEEPESHRPAAPPETKPEVVPERIYDDDEGIPF